MWKKRITSLNHCCFDYLSQQQGIDKNFKAAHTIVLYLSRSCGEVT
jgi:hypothetical protein